MKYGVLGTGMVGQALGTKLLKLGHEVMLGSRVQEHQGAQDWKAKSGGGAKIGDFRDAAVFGQILLNCTQGAITLDALRSIDRKHLAGKLLIDVANPLDFSRGNPPTLTICNTDSLGESIQREFTEAKVVKAFNTVNCQVMVDPGRVKGEHDIFICGNDSESKNAVKELLRDFGWKSIIDLGDITNARATEQLMPIWIRLWTQFGTADFINFKIVRN